MIFCLLVSYLVPGYTGLLLAWNASYSSCLVGPPSTVLLLALLMISLCLQMGCCVCLFEQDVHQAPPVLTVRRHLKNCHISKWMLLAVDSICALLSFLAKAWQFKFKDIFVGFPSLLNCQPGVAKIIISIFSTALAQEGFVAASKVSICFYFWRPYIWKISWFFSFLSYFLLLAAVELSI